MRFIAPALLVLGIHILSAHGRHGHGKRRHHRLLESVEWGDRPENQHQSQLKESDEVALGKDILFGNVDAVDTETGSGSWKSVTARTPNSNYDPPASPNSGGTGTKLVPSTGANKWGFNKECKVICKKLLCFGWGPHPAELCKRGNYKHRCCNEYKPLPGTYYQPSNLPVRRKGLALDSPALDVELRPNYDDSSGNMVPLTVQPITTITFPPTAVPTTTEPITKSTTVAMTTKTNTTPKAKLTSSQEPTPTTEPKTRTTTVSTKKPLPTTMKKLTDAPTTIKSNKLTSVSPKSKKPIAKITLVKPTTKKPVIHTKATKAPAKPKTTSNPKENLSVTTAKPSKTLAVIRKQVPKSKPTLKSAPTAKMATTTQATTTTVTTTTQVPNGCNIYSQSPKTCLSQPKCDFNCDTRQCEPTEKVVKRDADICKSHQCLLDICTCRGCNLTYNVGEGMCESHKNVCDKLSFSGDECLRPDQFYAYSGAICKSGNKQQRNCQVEETIMAVNFGGKGRDGRWVDSRNITHFSDEVIPSEDPYKTKQKWLGLPRSKMNVSENDRILYETTVHAYSTNGRPDKCLTYKIKLWQIGRYELSVKLADPSMGKMRHRMFNIRLNGVDVMAEVDIAAITNEKTHAVEIFLNFDVTHTGETLKIKGHPNTKIVDGYVDLSFCYGRCEYVSEYQDYVIAAFSVVKFSNEIDPESKKCSSYKGNACTSRKYACQYNVVTGDVVPYQNCSKLFFTRGDCVRKNTFYAHGGVLCHNNDIIADCKIAGPVFAVNLNGNRYGPDSRGIHYKAHRDLPPIVRYHNSSIKRKEVTSVSGVPEKDKPLFLSYLYGDGHRNSTASDDCIFWNIPVVKDGLYEISIKTAEYYYKLDGSRTFNVKVNDEYVIQELDLLGLAKKGTAVDIILNFEVMQRGSMLHLRGFPLKTLHGKIKLEFCYGGCKTEDRNWMLGAFYVARFDSDWKRLKGL